MWIGWFALCLFGLAILVFQFHKIGTGIVTTDGSGELYTRWFVLMIFLVGLAVGIAVTLMFIGDFVTITLLSIAFAIFIGFIILSYFRLKRYTDNNDGIAKSPKTDLYLSIYKSFIIYSALVWMMFIITGTVIAILVALL